MPSKAAAAARAFPFPDKGDPLAQAAEDIRCFHSAAKGALEAYAFRSFERDELLAALGHRGATERLLASNKRVRKRATEILVDEFAHLRKRSLKKPNRRFWYFSFLGPIITEYRPQIDLDAYRIAIDGLLRKTPLNALIAIELQPLTNYPQRGEGRGFLLNAHTLAWTDDLKFDARQAATEMVGTGALHSELGADTVKFRPVPIDEGELEWLGYYSLKAPADGKRRHYDDDTKAWSLKMVKAVRADLRLRLMEILSQVELTDLVHGFRGGKFIRSRWKQKLSEWNKLQCERTRHPLEKDFDTADLWRRVRSRDGNGSRSYRPVEFFGPRPRPIASERLPRAGRKRLRPSEPRVHYSKSAGRVPHKTASKIRLTLRDM